AFRPLPKYRRPNARDLRRSNTSHSKVASRTSGRRLLLLVVVKVGIPIFLGSRPYDDLAVSVAFDNPFQIAHFAECSIDKTRVHADSLCIAIRNSLSVFPELLG